MVLPTEDCLKRLKAVWIPNILITIIQFTSETYFVGVVFQSTELQNKPLPICTNLCNTYSTKAAVGDPHRGLLRTNRIWDSLASWLLEKWKLKTSKPSPATHKERRRHSSVVRVIALLPTAPTCWQGWRWFKKWKRHQVCPLSFFSMSTPLR